MGLWRRSVESLVVTPASPDPQFWRGRRVLVTGHTGFKGAWLCYWLARMGARVVGLALAPNTDPSLFSEAGIGSRVESLIVDIRDLQATRTAIVGAKPEIVFHLAAQPLVLRSYKAPVETFSTNVLGTVHVLESLRDLSDVTVAVMITTDKVYANREWVYPYREEDPLGGHDPYSASKAACEIVISSYRSSFLREQGCGVGQRPGGKRNRRRRLVSRPAHPRYCAGVGARRFGADPPTGLGPPLAACAGAAVRLSGPR